MRWPSRTSSARRRPLGQRSRPPPNPPRSYGPLRRPWSTLRSLTALLPAAPPRLTLTPSRRSGTSHPTDRDLLLAEELLLLSLDDEKGSDQTWSSLDGGLAGALLLELTEDGALRLDGDDKLVPGASAPADPLLAEALEAVRASDKPRDAKHWVRKLPGELKPLRRRLAERLVERGILGEDRKELLGLTVSRRYPERDPEPERALRARLLAALTGEAEPPPRDAALTGLLRPFDLVAKNVPREHRK
ncbi:MAG: GPP34 family phosphoprotein, partial [Solirubrobacterales bacterium]|nr:GPP34 family phosphoprotein [Solirubrobacterales bacterium]